MSWGNWILAYLFDCVHPHTTWPPSPGRIHVRFVPGLRPRAPLFSGADEDHDKKGTSGRSSPEVLGHRPLQGFDRRAVAIRSRDAPGN
jgi:hypothetical protein